MKARWGRAALYLGPLVLWMVFLLLAATAAGDYTRSWRAIQKTLSFLTPEFAPIEPKGRFEQTTISMYQINSGLRRLAHIAAYAGLTLLTVRACQWGQPRLRRRTFLVALLMSALFTAGESLVRLNSPGRHVRAEQLALNLIGTALVLGGTLAYFGLKRWERRLAPDPLEDTMAP